MSKREQTNILHLYTYNNLRGLPTFLKDWSNNMEILDSAHNAVLESISALDVRLVTAEGIIENLSPESIEDYKIRLDALENKVTINVNAIKDVNTRIVTINTRLSNIDAEQITQNNRLDAIESVNATQAEQITGLSSDLTSVTNRVTTLETCCETVQHEITDLQNDVNGFNEDITILTGQVETLSNLVTELNELVQSLQLDVVLARLTTIENSISAIEGEIGNTDYSEIGDTISDSLVELANRIRALTPQEYDVLVSRLASAESDIDELQSDVSGLQTGVANIQGLIPQGASSSNLLVTNSDLPDITGITNALTVNDDSANAPGLIRFAVDNDGNYGYKKVGADTVIPFKSGEINAISHDTLALSATTTVSNIRLNKSVIAPNTTVIFDGNLSVEKGDIVIIPFIITTLTLQSVLLNNETQSLDWELMRIYSDLISNDYKIFMYNSFFKIKRDMSINNIALVNGAGSSTLYSASSTDIYLYPYILKA